MKIKKNFLVISNYNNDLRWVPEYTDNYIIYDRSENAIFPETVDPMKVRKSPNVGYNSYDYCTFIIDNYDNLPECTIFAKGWCFPRHVRKEYFDLVMNNECFTPIEDWKTHKPKFPISFFSPEGGYCEINNSWYLKHQKTKYFKSYDNFLRFVYKDPVIPLYVRFAPGGDYIVPKANILKLPKVVYENLRLFMSHCQEPGETHIIERAMPVLWTSNFELNEKILSKIDENFIVEPVTPPDFLKKVILLLDTQLWNFYYFSKKVIERIKYGPNKESENESLSQKEIALRERYRSTIKIYDIFTYNGEADVLEIRLHILKDVVDEFIIVEAPTTFSGLKKPLYFDEQKERFAPFLDKIKYFVIDDYPNDTALCELADRSSNVPKNGPEHWRREFYQKESIKKALTHLSDEDICFVGDVDEIWNPEIVIDYRKDSVFKLQQIVYSYFLNNRSSEKWAGTLVTKYKNIKNNCLNHLRTATKTKYLYVKNGGWHFTSIGGIHEIRRKLNDSYTKESYNTQTVQDNLEKRFGKQDYIGRKFTFWIDESNLPKYILDNKEKYKNLFKKI